MQLFNYILISNPNRKIILKKNQIYVKKKKLFLFFLFKFYIFNSLFWMILNSYQSFSFFSRIQSFLRRIFLIFKKTRNQNSRIHLLHMRMENSILNSFKYDYWAISNLNKIQKIYITFNHLQIIPFRKNVSIKIRSFQAIIFLLNSFKKIFPINRLTLTDKKRTINLNIDKNINYSKKNTFQQQRTFETIFIEIVNLLSESACVILSLIYLIACRRNIYPRKVFFLLIKIGFIKINYFKDILIIKKNWKIPKIDPSLNNFLRTDNYKLITFLKFASSDFKILPSKNRIPLKIYMEIYGNFQFFKKNLCLKQNCIKKKQFQNIIIFKKKESLSYKILESLHKKYNKNFKKEIYIGEIKSWLEKYNNLKKGIHTSLVKKWSLEILLVKESVDFHNEILGIVFLAQLEKLFREKYLDLWLNSFFIYSVHSSGGLINIIPNSTSLHDLNKKKNLKDKTKFISEQEYNLKKRKKYNFIESLASYSLFCFIFQLKDRHNGNILLNTDGRIIHIDFGYILGYKPGNLKFEADSFKLSENFLLEIDGKQTEKYEYFRELFLRGFILLKKNVIKIITILRSLFFQNKSISNLIYKMKNLEKRFQMSTYDKNIIKFGLQQIQESIENWKTIQYDKYQLHASGIN